MASKPVYAALFLGDASRKVLLEAVPPTLPKVIAHHVTLSFGEAMTDLIHSYKIGEIYEIRVLGMASDEKAQCVAVDPKGIKNLLASAQNPHITISTDENTKPVYSNTLLKESGFFMWKEPIYLLGVLDFWPRTDPKKLKEIIQPNTHHSMSSAPCSQCGDLDGCHKVSQTAWNRSNTSKVSFPAALDSVRREIEQLRGI